MSAGAPPHPNSCDESDSWLHRVECRADLIFREGVIATYRALHKTGIVHGDIHPRHIRVGRDGHPSLIDFELARTVREESPDVEAETGEVIRLLERERERGTTELEPER